MHSQHPVLPTSAAPLQPLHRQECERRLRKERAAAERAAAAEEAIEWTARWAGEQQHKPHPLSPLRPLHPPPLIAPQPHSEYHPPTTPLDPRPQQPAPTNPAHSMEAAWQAAVDQLGGPFDAKPATLLSELRPRFPGLTHRVRARAVACAGL